MLRPANVGSASFGLLHNVPLDDQVDAQPLLVPGVTITAGNQQGKHDVVYVATEHNTIYAIDAESGTVLFEKGADDLIPPASLSKLMTAEVVFNEIKQGRLKPTTEFIVSTAAWRRGGAPSRTSHPSN